MYTSKVEVFKDIPGYEGHYSVSTRGRVYINKKGCFKVRNITRLRRQETVCCTLSKDGKRKTFTVGRLMALAFVVDNPNPKIYNNVSFINENSTDLRVENVYWTSRSIIQKRLIKKYPESYKENLRKMFERKPPQNVIGIGVSHKKKHLDGKSKREMYNMFKLGYSLNEISDKFGYSSRGVRIVCKRFETNKFKTKRKMRTRNIDFRKVGKEALPIRFFKLAETKTDATKKAFRGLSRKQQEDAYILLLKKKEIPFNIISPLQEG